MIDLQGGKYEIVIYYTKAKELGGRVLNVLEGKIRILTLMLERRKLIQSELFASIFAFYEAECCNIRKQ